MNEIAAIAKKVNEKHTKYSQLSWVQFTTGLDLGVKEGYQEILSVVKDKNHFETILSEREKVRDMLDKRRIELLYKHFKPYHKTDEINQLKVEIKNLTTDLSKLLNTFRCTFEGKKITTIELRKIISEDDDENRRRKAFMARNQLNKPLVEAGFIKLINLRKKLAHLEGYEDFVEMKLDEDELSPKIFDHWIDEAHGLFDKAKVIENEYAKKYLDKENLMPWDHSYIVKKIAPTFYEKVDVLNYYSHIKDLFMKFGFNLDDYNITYDVFPRDNKSEWGYNFPIKRGEDSRILANVKDRYSDYGVLLHETGHGLHSFLLTPDEILNYGVSGIISEGIANLFGSFILEEIFYENFFEKEKVKKEFEALKEWWKIQSVRAIHNILFDQNLYRQEINSLEDINRSYNKLTNELFGEEKVSDNPPWAMRIHYTTHPIYLHNYFMGDITCEMLKSVFTEKHGIKKVSEKPIAFGKFIKESIIDPSGRLPYEDLFKKISGEEFSLKYLK